MKKDEVGIGLRVRPEIRRKLKYIAAYEGRSMSGQILCLIQKCVRDFEKEHGPIDLTEE